MDENHHPFLSPLRTFQVAYGLNENEEYFSLSDSHDYEPCLEFDDSEFIPGLPPLPPEMIDVGQGFLTPSDGTIEENFEEELADSPPVYKEIADSLADDSFALLRESGVVEVMGDDHLGRRIIIISACRLPSNKEIHPDKLLEYIMFTLDKFVEQDYSVVYFHYGLNSNNKPPLSWLWKAYKTFDRKYKKNLQALYLVHPTNFIRFVWQMLKPALSVKFGRKVAYLNNLRDLGQYIPLSLLAIPKEVMQYDKSLNSNQFLDNQSKSRKPLPPITTQFGVSLQFIRDYNVETVDSIPPIVRTCVEYLSQPCALETEGIFRRSGKVEEVQALVGKCNAGEPVDFDGDYHLAAVLLKAFLRYLEEPIMTFALYDDIMSFPSWNHKDRPRRVKIMLMEILPLENYQVLKYIVKFLWKVQERSCMNKMTVSNLAIVFGPNLVWGKGEYMSLRTIEPVNCFMEYLLANQESLFIV